MKKAIAIIDGDISDQFKVVWNYCNEIVRANPNTSVYMKLVENEDPSKHKRFKRFYICFSACKEGFKSGCRRIIGVDGCWLEGPMYGTHLLTAIGLDPNNNIYLIAYAIVEKECHESWAWFLNHLKLDLEIDDEANWTFMSDKQKGLIEAFNEILPFVTHRFCVRHLHNNFKRTGFNGNTLRNALWKATSVITVKWFDKCMLKIIDLDPAVASWLRDKSTSERSRSHFSENVKSNRDKSAMWSSDDICSRIKDVLHKSQVVATEYIPRKANQWNYKLTRASITDNWAVDLLNRNVAVENGI
uniref:MULE transposase domain-containing protein n=1 Tax=Nicotiana tabacum TaxID=4097 RepID=A0A1S3YAA9_TOBAC|nr:PREDICTED: uncharacterized protein LOC107774080 [Nicotiana tabacum]